MYVFTFYLFHFLKFSLTFSRGNCTVSDPNSKKKKKKEWGSYLEMGRRRLQGPVQEKQRKIQSSQKNGRQYWRSCSEFWLQTWERERERRNRKMGRSAAWLVLTIFAVFSVAYCIDDKCAACNAVAVFFRLLLLHHPFFFFQYINLILFLCDLIQ